ncbi:aminopeptidase N [Micrococcus lylae]|uniref:aminopeptidase N n=1 Tax=Micrococcus lylae TaxID=1273 RepID=UPI0021A8A9E6|nr:aminopeptidase N [Micrococcus lylae]MCT2007253.1 aminopeptidase N [Micrococcus lylae]MCT2070925.1 aminopeptidase N [Micrococcus lylae]
MSENTSALPRPDWDTAELTRDEARGRANVVSVRSYDVCVDVRNAEDAGAEAYPVTATLVFSCSEPGSETWLDWINASVESVELNGETLDVAEVAGRNRVRLPGLAAENTVVLRGTSLYSRSGEGMHRYVDPADGQTYLYTQYEPADARRVFPNFEQPDLKASFSFRLTGPAAWVLASNGAETSRTKNDDGSVTVAFQATRPQSTYITTLLAGPYAVFEDHWGGHEATGAVPVDLRIFCRQTLAEHMDADAVFAITKNGLDFFHDLFGVPYEWGKYDQAFVPEYNLGAMENPGLVTFTEHYIHDTAPTRAQLEGRANTILHEMAHMWFGDLVTMRWWDDLWLKESFADYMGTLASAEAAGFTEAWTSFASRRKAWAYVQDQYPTTHPIVADIVDLEAARQNFDGITYAKGASVLKQLAAYVGREAFEQAARTYFRRHAWGNAELKDFLAVLSEASGRDMSAWADAWLHTAGVPTLRVDIVDGTAVLVQSGEDPTTGEPIRRPHVVQVGVYEPNASGALMRTDSVTVDVAEGVERTPIRGLEVPEHGVRLVLPNDEDLTYAAVSLDQISLDAVLTHRIADPLAQATVWASLWAMVRGGELSVAAFVDAVEALADTIAPVAVYTQVLTQAASAVSLYAAADERARLRTRLGSLLLRHVAGLEAGSDRQRAAARVLALLARKDAELAGQVEQALVQDAETAAPGLAVDTEIRWLVLQALAATGGIDRAGLDTALAEQRTAKTVVGHTLAVNALPEAQVKQAAWDAVISGVDAAGAPLSNDLLSATAEGFATDAGELTAGYGQTLFGELEQLWSSRSNGLASRAIHGLFPLHQDAVDGDEAAQEQHPVLAAAQAWIDGHPDAPGALRRLVIEETDALRRSLRVQSRQEELRHI